MDRPTHPYEKVAEELAGTAFSAIAYVIETASTNADAAALLGDPRHLGRSIVAERQTRGAGRKGRTWTALPETSLLVTTIVPLSVAVTALWAVPFWAALAVRAALARCGIAAELRWPNDLLLPHGKVAGILCVSRVTGDVAWVACGVGINVHRPPEGSVRIEPPPAFCDDVARVERPELLRGLLRAYDSSLDELHSPDRIAAAWETAAGLPGVRYRILKDGEGEPFEATALRLDRDGGLVVERNGRLETISFADARILRAPSTSLRSAQDDTN